MPESFNEPQVIIPYSTLCELLEASMELKRIRIDMKRFRDELSRVRYQQIEIMEKIAELE